eukprot:TRINITY_DN62848_c0_g2_i1.p1 TRINITY_DN62848_c0_g2~~TRINITY_DN62848_c0_g2_i1.p1  ORF type:complete len:131 (+),score=17.05 TRINITY_DN62848_c0_g2_i1:352-744(+)
MYSCNHIWCVWHDMTSWVTQHLLAAPEIAGQLSTSLCRVHLVLETVQVEGPDGGVHMPVPFLQLLIRPSSNHNGQLRTEPRGLDALPCAHERRECGPLTCLLYTSDAADEEDSVDLGGRRIIKKKKKRTK